VQEPSCIRKNYLASVASPTRERILDAALELIQQQGFGGTTVTDIEELAGLSPGSGSFYRHFRSKEEVFREVFERELARAQRRREEFERGPVADPREALTRRLVQQLEYLTQVRPLMNLLAREHGRFPDLTRRVRSLLVDQGIAEEAEHLTRDLPAGPGRDDPHALLAVVVSALTGYELSRGFFGRPPADIAPDRFATALAALITARTDR
jgi:AcrR family transcriptional regulator